MNARPWSFALFSVAILGVLAVSAQHRQLVSLRTQQPLLMSPADAPSPDSISPVPASKPGPPSTGVSLELLKLRNEVSLLTARQKELASVRQENKDLQAQMTSRSKAPPITSLPSGYVTRSRARMVGLGSPENTIESLLWAFQEQNSANLDQFFTEDAVARFTKASQQTLPQYLSRSGQANSFPGMAIVERTPLSNGKLRLRVQILPELPLQTLELQQVNGQWKVAEMESLIPPASQH